MRKRRLHKRYGRSAVEPVTPVIFRIWPKSKGGDVIALFPAEPGTSAYDVNSYMHVGQHGSADLGLINETRPATAAEYASLKHELEGAPYNYRLKVVQRATQHHMAARRKAMAR